MRNPRSSRLLWLVAGLALTLAVPASARAQDRGDIVGTIKRVRQLVSTMKEAQVKEAIALLEKEKPRFGKDDMWVWWGAMGNARAELGDGAGSMEAFANSLKANASKENWYAEDRSRALITVADALFNKGGVDGAVKFLEAHADKVLKDVKLLYYGRLGQGYDLLRNHTKALEHYGNAIRVKSDSMMRRHRATIYHMYGRWDEARADLDADSALRKEEREAGRQHPLRIVVDGTFKAQWPHAWRKCELRSKYGHFHIVSNAGMSDDDMDDLEKKCARLDPDNPRDRKKLAKLCRPTKQLTTVATLMELVRNEYMKAVGMKKQDWPKDRVFKVFYFESSGDFRAFNTKQGNPDSESALGYFFPRYKFLCLYNAVGGENVYGMTEETMDTFFHEGWHQFYDVLTEKSPIWLNEGIAEYMGPAKVTAGGKKITIGVLVKKRGNERYTRYMRIKEMIRMADYTKFRKFFRMTPKEWHGGETLKYYAQAWSICYYALRGRNAAFKKDFLKLFWGTTKGRSLDDLIDDYFPNKKLDAYEKAWRAFMKKL